MTADAPKVLVRTRGLDTACADGTCPTGCSHLEWNCPNCSSEGAWGAAREVVERAAAEHECPPLRADTPHEPKPTSKTGYLDSPVYCETCNGSLYPSEDTEDTAWRHVRDTPHPTQEWTPRHDEIDDLIADALGEHEHAWNAFDITDEATTVLAEMAVEDISRWLTPYIVSKLAEVERVARADERGKIAAALERQADEAADSSQEGAAHLLDAARGVRESAERR